MSNERVSDRVDEFAAQNVSVALVVSRFNEALCDQLLEGALSCLREHGAREEDLEVFRVPGSFELPMVARRLAGSRRYAAVICLGVLIRGETAHFELVAAEVARGIGSASAATNVPILFGVVTAENIEQAEERAGGKMGNRGRDAALAALEMADVMRRLEA